MHGKAKILCKTLRSCTLYHNSITGVRIFFCKSGINIFISITAPLKKIPGQFSLIMVK